MAQRLNPSNDPVLLYQHATKSGHVVAEARFNSEPTLHALSLDMIDILRPALARWKDDADVVAITFTATGERAFSAGGDIQALYHAMVRNHAVGERVEDYPYDFFEREYRLDYALHTFPKPVLALGHGVIMGGGLGIFSAADFRLVSEKVRIALPEVTIGLFPDAGGTWLLRNLAPHHALFLGLTGSSINSADALIGGVATHAVAFTRYSTLLDELCELEWRGEPADTALIAGLLDAEPRPELPRAQLDQIPERLSGTATDEVVGLLRSLQGTSDWVDKGIAALERGCPTTVGIVVQQLARSRSLSLADCFRMEMTIATHCADNHDFAEGVRALLIEKDNAPQWQFGDLESVPMAYVDSHFEEPWPDNPLNDLEDEQ